MVKVSLKEWTMVVPWKWKNIFNDEKICGICQNPFEMACPVCKFPGDSCPLVSGSCKHYFHSHCIVKWTNTQLQNDESQTLCPMCRQVWNPVPF